MGDTIYSVGQHGSAFIKGLKCALRCLGICDDVMAEPFHRFRPPQREQIQQYLAELGIASQQTPQAAARAAASRAWTTASEWWA